jgi:ATP-dependent Lon protease
MLAVLPLRDLVVFPKMTVPLIVGRPGSQAAIDRAWEGSKTILLLTQRSVGSTRPDAASLYGTGTIGRVLQRVSLPDGNLKVLVEGTRRARVAELQDIDDLLLARTEAVTQTFSADAEQVRGEVKQVRETFEVYSRLNKGIPPEMTLRVEATDQPGELADLLIAHLLGFAMEDRQALLEELDPMARLERVLRHLQGENEILQVERKIKSRVKRQIERNQKEIYLNEQNQGMPKDMADKDEFKAEFAELQKRLAAKEMPEVARARGERELRKLRMMSPMSAEATVVRNYVDWLLSLPWSQVSEEKRDLAFAANVLDEDHFGLDKVKDRILEQLAVESLVEKSRGPILCLVGPPGVGKTSLGRSIARATGRPFVRQALGGVRDEASIRGHRRTYIGALPGKILQGLRRAEASNPVFLLDEIDKMSTDFRGDPSAALLEVLDPEQNATFADHYLDLDYDLSRVLFVCTANGLAGIPGPLRDRLEIIEVSGYTANEKLRIAERYLIPKQREATGLTTDNIQIDPEAVSRVVQQYTREAGVRGLERELARMCRKVARRVVEEGEQVSVQVGVGEVDDILGVPRHVRAEISTDDEVGLVKGLAVTPWGGEVLEIEVTVLPGKGKLILTGRLGDWLKESATAAFSYVRSRADVLGVAADVHETNDLHVHYPGNSLKTDGPSAGIAMTTALVSALLHVPVRGDLAMTGEVSLRGRVLPIGGVKSKLLAAWRRGARTVLIPKVNAKDLRELPEEVQQGLKIFLVGHMDDVLAHALAWEGQSPEWLGPQREPWAAPIEQIST